MRSYFDQEFARDLSLHEYFDSLKSFVKRAMVESMFDFSFAVLSRGISNYPSPRPALPEFRISSRPGVYLEGIEGVIFMGTSFIDDCLGRQLVPLHELVVLEPTEPQLPFYFPDIFFAWAVAHEYVHGLRRHNIALERVGNRFESQRAVEIDADLIATAYVYRQSQAVMSPTYSDLSIRQVVFSSLFWSIRILPDSTEPTDHPCKFERLYHIVAKLTHLRINPSDLADRDGVQPETQVRRVPLIELLVRCEKAYKLNVVDDPDNLFDFLRGFFDSKSWGSFVAEWEVMSPIVRVASGT